MSRINSMFKKATQAAQQTVKAAKQETASLYDAGAKKPGRTTNEHVVTFGRADTFGDDSQVAGVQLRGFTQRASTVVSAGGDVFAGVKQKTVTTDADGTRRESLAKLGAEAGGSVFAGSVNGFRGGVQIGAELQDKATRRTDLGDGKQLKHEETTRGFWGAVARGGAQLGSVTGAEVELFVGAKGVGEERYAITDGAKELAGVAGRFGVLQGVGVLAHVEVGYDVDNRQARASGDVGAALIVGAQVGGDVTVGGKDE